MHISRCFRFVRHLSRRFQSFSAVGQIHRGRDGWSQSHSNAWFKTNSTLINWIKQSLLILNSNLRWLTETGTRIRSVSTQLGKWRAHGGVLEEGTTSTSIGRIRIGCHGSGGWRQSTVSVMSSRSRMNSVAVVRRGIVVVVMNRAVWRMRMRVSRMSEWVWWVRMMTQRVHGVVRMTRMVCVVDCMRMVTAVVVMVVVMARMRAQVGSSCGSRSSVRQAEKVGQVLPPMLHAHRAH